MRWLRARRSKSFWRSIRQAQEGRSISFFWRSTTRITREAISIAPSSLTPSFNEATHIVNYSIEIDPGPLYKMGAVQFDGAPDAMAVRLENVWKLAPGDNI